MEKMTPKTKIALFALFIAEGCTAAYAAINGDGLACIGWLLTTSLSAVVAILHCMNNDLNKLVLLREDERDNALRDLAKETRTNDVFKRVNDSICKENTALKSAIAGAIASLKDPNTKKADIKKELRKNIEEIKR